MEISIKWFEGKYPSFNVAIASQPGRDPFVEIKGCRIVKGKDGEFVAPPSTKGNNRDFIVTSTAQTCNIFTFSPFFFLGSNLLISYFFRIYF